MDSQDFVSLKRQEPFRPFRVKTADGQAHDVVHPDLLMLCRKHMVIGFPRQGSSEPFFETFARVEYADIKQVDKLDPDKALQTK